MAGFISGIEPEALYRQISELLATAPEVHAQIEQRKISPETHRWLGRAHALVEATGNISDVVALRTACGYVVGGYPNQWPVIIAALHRALAAAELRSPAAVTGSFIPSGAAFDAFAIIGKILEGVKQDALVVDPYLNHTFLTDFAMLAPNTAKLRLMGDSRHSAHYSTLKPAAERWQLQHDADRAIEIRLAPERSLHDRMILVDRRTAWALSQSFKDFAARSPGSALRADTETSAMKVEALSFCGNQLGLYKALEEGAGSHRRTGLARCRNMF